MGKLDNTRTNMNPLIIGSLFVGVVFCAQPPHSKTDDLTGPSCTPSDAAKAAATWNRCPFGQDPNAWYGLTNTAVDYIEAARQCASYGGELLSASDQVFDFCAISTIDQNMVFDEMVLYSGRWNFGLSSWAWCYGDRCDSVFDYTNWGNSSSLVGNCMGGYLEDYVADGSVLGVNGYGWVNRDCRETLVRALCRLDCDSVAPATTTIYQSE